MGVGWLLLAVVAVDLFALGYRLALDALLGRPRTPREG